jgi:hypothetical protein
MLTLKVSNFREDLRSHHVLSFGDQKNHNNLIVLNVHFVDCSDKRLRGMLKNFCGAGLLKEEKDGQIFKYSAINKKATKQGQLATQEKASTKTDFINTLSRGHTLLLFLLLWVDVKLIY